MVNVWWEMNIENPSIQKVLMAITGHAMDLIITLWKHFHILTKIIFWENRKGGVIHRIQQWWNLVPWWKSNQLCRPWPSLCFNCKLLQCFLDGFLESENITKKEGHKLFKFGGGEQLKSKMFCCSLWNYWQRCYSWM